MYSVDTWFNSDYITTSIFNLIKLREEKNDKKFES